MSIIKSFVYNTEKSIKIKYHDWRHCNYLKGFVKEDYEKDSKKRTEIKYINKPGIVFSFDDSFRVEGWYEHIRKLFGYYDIRATFNVNAFHHFQKQREHTQDEIDKLIALQSYGHEIAHHTFRHHNAVKYTDNFGTKKWIEDEINPLFLWLEKQKHSKTNEGFKKPVSFAFPYFSASEKLVNVLVPSFFKVVRGGKNKLLTPFNETGFIPSIDIDRNVISNSQYIKKIIKHLKQTGKNMIFTCHSVIEDNIKLNESGMEEEEITAMKYRISPKQLEILIKEAKKNDLEFYTTAEVAGVATFIDVRFENYIREISNTPPNQWIKISDLITIRELDLSNKEITNLDGLQYFINLEKLDISHNNIKDLRLTEKLPKLKNIVENYPDKEITL